MVTNLKKEMQKESLFLLGRFAEWDYYNMDVAIGAALELNEFFKMKMWLILPS